MHNRMSAGNSGAFGSRRGASAVTIMTIIFAALFLATGLYGFHVWREIAWTQQQMQATRLDEFDRRVKKSGSWEEQRPHVKTDDGLVQITFTYKEGVEQETVKDVKSLKDEIADLEARRHQLSNLIGFGYAEKSRTDYNTVATELNLLAGLHKRGTSDPWFAEPAGAATTKPIPSPIDLSLSGSAGGKVEIVRDEETGKETARTRTVTLDPANYDTKGQPEGEEIFVYTHANVQGIEIKYTISDLVDELVKAISGEGGLTAQIKDELDVIDTKWGHPDDLYAGGKISASWSKLEDFWPDGQEPKKRKDWTPEMEQAWREEIGKGGFFGLESELKSKMAELYDTNESLQGELASAIDSKDKKFEEIFGTWTWSLRDGFRRTKPGTLAEKRESLGRKLEEVRQRRVVWLARVEELFRARGRFKVEIDDLRATLNNLRDPTAQKTPFEQYIAKIQAERRKKPEETALQKDGEVVYSNSAQKVAYIDLARRHGVFPGMTFDVYHYKKGGIPEKKGEVRVKKVEEDLSLVVIAREEFELNPIGEGDFIVNEVFDRNKTKYFTFAGRIEADYTNEQATSLIQELGHVVEPRISARTDYVILGADYSGDENWLAAERLGIEQLTQQDLLRWLGKAE